MKIVRFALVLLLFLCALTFGTLMRSRAIEHKFARLRVAQDRAQVLQIMGSPAREQGCKPNVQQSPGCRTELLYAHPLAPVVPEYWIVSLDASAKVVALIHTTTP